MNIKAFNKKVAIVTGGASGIGQALARELAARNATVVIADIHFDIATEVAEEICQLGQRAWAAELDVKDYLKMKELIYSTAKKTGTVDYIFNNAGIFNQRCKLEEYSIKAWEELNDVNYGGVINGVLASYKFMIQQGSGHIVNTSSISGLIPVSGISYSGSKYAITGMSLALREEARKYGIKVSLLCPGWTRTPIFLGQPMKNCPVRLDKSIEKNKPISANILAKKILDNVALNKKIIIYPWRQRMLYYFFRYLNVNGTALLFIDRLLRKI